MNRGMFRVPRTMAQKASYKVFSEGAGQPAYAICRYCQRRILVNYIVTN
jgi:hypothetical protein